MTASEWPAREDPHTMLKSLESRASERKSRLFAVACCRRYGHLLREEASRTAVLVAERFADGQAGEPTDRNRSMNCPAERGFQIASTEREATPRR